MTEPQKSAGPPKRHRVLRYVSWAITILLVLMVLAGFAAYRLAAGVPEWYRPGEEANADGQADQAWNKWAGAQNWAGAKHAYETAKEYGPPKAKEPERELVVAFSQTEINALLARWYGQVGSQSVNGQKLTDVLRGPMVRIATGEITIAGTVPSLGGKVVSMGFAPAVTDGKLELRLLKVRSGNLPLPDFAWGQLRGTLGNSLQGLMVKYARAAKFDRGGAANGEAVSAVLAKQGADLLAERAMDNVLFIPIVSQNWGMAVRLKKCELQDGMMTLTTEPLDSAECNAVLKDLKAAVGGAMLLPGTTPATRNTR